jgi:single-strand DNA-binding protein
MNRVEIMGGLTRDAELRFLPSGIAVLNFTVAVNGARYDSSERQQVVTTSYISVEAWGSLAEEAADSGVTKGCEVYVMGELTQQTIEKRDGEKESKTRVKAHIISVTRRPVGDRGPAPAKQRPAPRSAPASSGDPGPSEPAPEYADDEEPF